MLPISKINYVMYLALKPIHSFGTYTFHTDHIQKTYLFSRQNRLYTEKFSNNVKEIIWIQTMHG